MDILLMEPSHGVFPQSKDLPSITPKMATANTDYLPYKRDEKLVRNWAVPGMEGFRTSRRWIKKKKMKQEMFLMIQTTIK